MTKLTSNKLGQNTKSFASYFCQPFSQRILLPSVEPNIASKGRHHHSSTKDVLQQTLVFQSCMLSYSFTYLCMIHLLDNPDLWLVAFVDSMSDCVADPVLDAKPEAILIPGHFWDRPSERIRRYYPRGSHCIRHRLLSYSFHPFIHLKALIKPHPYTSYDRRYIWWCTRTSRYTTVRSLQQRKQQ